MFTSILSFFISLPAVSLGILSGSQHGSSTPWFLSLCFGSSLSFRVLFSASNWFLPSLLPRICLSSSSGPAWAYCPARPLSSLIRDVFPSFVPPSTSSSLLFFCLWPKVAIPKVATPWDPQVVCSSHVDLPCLRWRCLCSSAFVPPMLLVACAAGCLSLNCLLAFSSPP